MPAFLISDEEREALRGLPILAREAYVFGLRPFMDYATGIVGIKRGVSWKSIAEELYVEPHQGVESGGPSEKQLRRAIVWLQKAGLLSDNRGERRLIFELLQASRDQSARNKEGSKRADHPGSQADREKPSNHAGYQWDEGSQAGGGKTQKEGTPPESGKARALPPLPPKGEGKPKAPKFDPLTVCPVNVSPDTWADWCRHRAEIKKPLTATSCSHQAKQLANHPAPDSVIEASIANGWQGLFPERVNHHGNRQDHRGVGPQSAVDRVKAAIAAREAGSAPSGPVVDQADRAVREPLDGEFRRVG